MSIRGTALAVVIGALLGWGCSYHVIQAEWLAAGIEGVALLSFWAYMVVDHWRVMGLLRR